MLPAMLAPSCTTREAFGAIKRVPEIVNIFCATANPTDVLIVENERGRGILGVIDGSKPHGIEGPQDHFSGFGPGYRSDLPGIPQSLLSWQNVRRLTTHWRGSQLEIVNHGENFF